MFLSYGTMTFDVRPIFVLEIAKEKFKKKGKKDKFSLQAPLSLYIYIFQISMVNGHEAFFIEGNLVVNFPQSFHITAKHLLYFPFKTWKDVGASLLLLKRENYPSLSKKILMLQKNSISI